LCYGAEKSGRVQVNLAKVDEFVAESTVLGCDAATARRYGDVKNRLRGKGRPLPENDVWIAAMALRYGLVLVSRDAHFREVEFFGSCGVVVSFVTYFYAALALDVA
jgi:tRNA(fMet)-specific endonuclease VapC